MRSAVVALGAWLLAAGMLPAAAGDEPILSETLPCGATLVTQALPGSPTFGIVLTVKGGRAEDAPGLLGVTEILSRMLLRGSLTRDAEAQALGIEGAGATMEATGGVLGVMLRSSGPTPALERALEILLDAAVHPRLDAADLDGEMRLARQRLGASLDIPSTWRERASLPLLFPDHPLGRVAGLETYLDSIDIDTVRAAHTARFRAARMSLVVVGDMDAGAIRRIVQARLAGLPVAGGAGAEQGGGPATALTAALPTPRPLAEPRRARVKRRTTQPELLVALPTAGIAPQDEPVMDVLVHILTGPEERLALEIRQARGWAYWIAPMDWRYPGAGAFGVLTAVPRKHLEETTGIILREMERIAKEPPGLEEVERARRYLLAGLARSWQRPSGRAGAYASAWARGRPPLSYDAAAERYAGVTPDQVRDLAGRLMAWSRPVLVTLY